MEDHIAEASTLCKRYGLMGQSLRILHVINGLELGGAETLLFRLATAGDGDVHHEVICLGGRAWYSSLLEEHGVRVRHLGMRAATFAPRMLRLRHLLRTSDADVVQSWLYVSNVLSGLWARPAGKPVVWGIHASTHEHISRFSRFCARVGGRASTRLADFVINCSSSSAELHSGIGYDRVPNAIVHNGYDPERFFPDEDSRRTIRRQLGVGEHTFLIGSVARWHSQKDIPNLLEATRLLRQRGLQIACLLVGGSLDRSNPELDAEIRRVDCGDAVIAVGPQANVVEHYRALDLHVLASSGGEAFPNVVAESMLCGTPNVVTDVGDSAMMVGDSGWVVPPRNPQQLAEAITSAWREWSDDPDRWQQRRASARRLVVENYTFDRMAVAYRDIWRSVAKGRSKRA